jgi:hypothetical protein
MMVREGMYTEMGRGNSYQTKKASARQEQMSQ